MENNLLDAQGIIDMLQKALSEKIGECPICQQRKWEYFGGRYHYGLRIEYWICSNCCLVAQSPRLSEDDLGMFYAHFYRQLYAGDAEPSDAEIDFQRKRGQNLLSIFIEISGQEKCGHLLDFGCSAGGLLLEAVKHFGADNPVGVELDKSFGSRARSYGFSVFSSLDEVDQHFDLITMSHVLEHVPNPVCTLSQIWNHLHADGFLCIEVPHSMGGACFEVTHLWGFNESSISSLLYKMDFDVVGMKKHGYPRNPERVNSYLSVVAQKKHSRGGLQVKPYWSSAFTERMRRYQDAYAGTTALEYQIVLARNTLKQLLRMEPGRLVAHTWFPSQLQRFEEKI